MKQFFKSLFACLAAFFIFFGLLILILIGIGSIADKPVEVNPNSILRLKLNTPIVDRAVDNPFENFDFSSMESNAKMGLNEILLSLKKAANDENIKGVYIDLTFVDAGFASVEEIRDALQAFKDSTGKFVVSYSEVYTQKAYYLASVSDEIYLYPQGGLEFRGLSSTRMFMKGMFKKLEIEPQIIRHGKFKSAVEPFIMDKMSEENREQTSTYISSIWNHVLKGISTSRGITENELNHIADSMLIQKPEDAVKYNFVTKLVYGDEFHEILKQKLGLEEDDKLAFIDVKKYVKVETDEDKGKLKKDKIAVIYAQGSIESGKGDHETIGSEKIAEAIRKARKDEKVKAIVFRVNSPGGSALASDVIWREATLAKKEKPFVVSMGDVAASGGYYISCAADKILASENTITGSIGVFGIIPNFQKFFNNKLGITFDGVKSNENADLGVTKPLTAQQRDIIQKSVENIYDVFITRVADGRGVTKEQVDEIGQGRVWSGIDAKERKLVDDFGGLNKAIETAKQLAKMDDYRIAEYPEIKDPIEELITEIIGENESKILANIFGTNMPYFSYLKDMSKLEGIQARLPYHIEIE